MISLISLLGSLTIHDLRSGLESGPGALRGGGGECGVFAQTEDWRWVHRNGGWERVSVCGMRKKLSADGNACLCAVAVGTFDLY